jgi:hypothetical protein
MRRIKKILTLSALALATSFILGNGSPPYSSSNQCWLLNSPLRQYLSGSGESALEELCTRIAESRTFSDQTRARVSRSTGFYEIQTSSNILVNNPATDIPENTTQSETTITVFGETIMVGFVDTGQALPLEPGSSSRSGIARSADHGETFVDLGKAPPNPRAIGISDPSLAVDSKGTFYISTIQQVPAGRSTESYMGVAKSTDGGQSFSPAVLIAGTGPTTAHFQDKELIAADNTGGPFDGYLYMAWTEFAPGGSQILFVRSTDGAQTFSSPLILSDGKNGVQGATPAVGPNGEVYVLWLSFGQRSELKIRKSLDGGLTFEPERVVAPFSVKSDSTASRTCGRRALKGNIRYLELPSMAADHSSLPTRGTLYVTYSSAPEGTVDIADVFLVRSIDAGESWSAPLRVNDDQTQSDQFQPALAVAKDGTLGIMFYDRRLDPGNLNIDVFMTRSTDGGQTFESNIRVTDRSFPVPPIAINGRNFDNLRSICYMGDYNQMAADDTFFYLVWGDNRATLFTERFPAPDGRPDPDVFFAKTPVHSSPPSYQPTMVSDPTERP